MSKKRKEYNDRWTAKLVNPGFTLAEYENERKKDRLKNLTQEEIDSLTPENREKYFQLIKSL
jgi:hypothetical protein